MFSTVFVLLAGCDGPAGSMALARCDYQNQFASNGRECREYLAGWTLSTAEINCLDLPEATFTADASCDVADELGRCVVSLPTGDFEIVNEGADTETCDDLVLGCELFAEGTYRATGLCEGIIETGE